MKRFLFFGLLGLTLCQRAAAGDNKKEVLTLSNGKYVETFDQDSVEAIGNILYNVNSRQIVGFIDQEPEETETSMQPEVISRWLSIDPLAAKYPSISPYAFAANNPILYVDPDGREIRISYRVQDEMGVFSTRYVTYNNGKLYNENGSRYKGADGYVLKVSKDIDLLKKDDKELSRRVGVLQGSKEIHTISDPQYSGENGNGSTPLSEDAVVNHQPTGSDVEYDPNNNENIRGDVRNPRAGLAHDLLGHSYDFDQGTARSGETANGIPNEEVDAVKVENLSRTSTGDPQKTTYGGQPIPESDLKAPLQDSKKQ